MAKLDNYKRVSLPKGGQNKLLNNILSKISTKEAAKLCSRSERTIRDWRREKFLIDIESLRKLSKKTNILIPSNIKLKDRWWYVHLGASIGGKIVWEKYGSIGDPEYRKKKWYEWWEKEGKYNKNAIGHIKSIHIPRLSEKVAEFTGIVMGDGSLTKNQLQITLNKEDDKLYAKFIKKLIKEIFKVPVSIYQIKNKKAIILAVSRKKLVEFCHKNLNLPIGHKIKQGLDIPNWIKKNIKFQKACIRGLIDTDGCIFNEIHHINGKTYSYKRLNFTSASPKLIQSVFFLLKQFNFSPKIRGDRSVQIEKKDKIKQYFKIIGTHNPKHLKRYLK